MTSRALLALTLSLTSIGLSGCKSTPPPVAPTISYETKVGWIIRLEDERILADPAAAAPPPPVVITKRGKNDPTPPPLATPDLIKLLTDSDARIRRRAALGIGRVGLPAGVAPLGGALKDADVDVRQMAAFALGLVSRRVNCSADPTAGVPAGRARVMVWLVTPGANVRVPVWAT